MSNGFEIPSKPKKGMKAVADYERKRQLQIFKGQCFNNACVLYSPIYTLQNIDEDLKNIFKLAQELYDEGIKRDWLKINNF